MTARKNDGRTAAGKFAAGNPGRPKGARHKTTLAVQALLEGQAEGLTQSAIKAALDGDVTALKLCLDRIAPAARERLVEFKMPPMTGAADVPGALGALMTAVARGELAPGEAATLAGVVERYRSAYELAELERRVSEIEQRQGATS